MEHIIPESIGNKEHTLPPGVVCDRCNNYFARKIEKPLLETSYFRHLRFIKRIRNKKGNPSKMTGAHLQSLTHIELYSDTDGEGVSLAAANIKDEARLINSLKTAPQGTFIMPMPTKPDNRLMSRFLCKLALEALALRLFHIPEGLNEVTDKPELDAIRNYARQGGPVAFWQYHERQLYSRDFIFYEAGYGPYEVLHEWTFLYAETQELYFIVVLFGIEYAINVGSPEIAGYKKWLFINSDQSPLYTDGIGGLENS